MKKLLTLLILSATVVLTGCAGLNTVSSQVSSFGTWPASRAPGLYAFERLPSQEQNQVLQDVLERAAAPALAEAGFKPADSVAQADVLVQVGAQERVLPGWGRHGGNGLFGRVGFGGFFGRGFGFGGIGLGMDYDPPPILAQVDLLIRDRRTAQVLYETHAVNQRSGSLSEALIGPLFQAALKDFPSPAISPRVVTVPRAPQAAASQP